MILNEYVKQNESFIKGWFIPNSICDNLIEYYKKSEKNHQNYKSNIYDKEIQVSTNLEIDKNNKEDTIFSYRKYLQICLEKYIEQYTELKNYYYFNINDSFFIQHYKPNQGFKLWHSERTGAKISKRVLVFMTYLNDVENGGTIFKYQNLTTPAKKGLTLIWPSDFTHTHKSEINKKNEKYIITGWYSFND